MLPIAYLKPAEHYLKKLVEKPLKKAYLDAIIAIRRDPFIGSLKKGDLSGIYGFDVFYKGTNYEIAYRVETTNDREMIVIILVGMRENFYRELKRYLKS